MKYKIYYTYTNTEAVQVEADTWEEAEEKFWNDEYLGVPETIMGSDANVQVEEIHDDKGEMVYPSNPFSVENTQVYENQLP